MCQDLLLKGFTVVLNEQPLLALELAGCCKSLRDVCRPHLIFEDLSKLLLKKWAVPRLKWGIPFFCLVICPDSETRLARYFGQARSYERALAGFQNHTLNLIPWDVWYDQALNNIAYAVCIKDGRQCVCGPPKSADRGLAKQLLSKQVFQEDMHAIILQATADFAVGLTSMKCQWAGFGPRILHVQSVANSIYHLSLHSLVNGTRQPTGPEFLLSQACVRFYYKLSIIH